MRVDLNADMGESFGSWVKGNDEALLDIISSANIACGFHAGDPDVPFLLTLESLNSTSLKCSKSGKSIVLSVLLS